MSYIEITAENFEAEVLKETNLPVLVDFWAPWCGPCMMLAPVIEELADELDGKVKICKADCDENGDLAMEWGVSSIPCMVLFKNGEEADRLVGLQSKQSILNFLAK